MTTNPNEWFLTRHALDQKSTAAALSEALKQADADEILIGPNRENLADDVAISLARAGFALVRLTPGPEDRVADLMAFLSRRED